ncbi:hypothetical protein CYMTET_3545 [Cymbomonas tetramitiformis]|uniref:Uncharacterized protein n=1 Tax=Cymbomonas tetramitiformis TaxID=36881 RepID=A0AAE0H308_9CHLO|nr:hypothetical protein CYMTET_3545 [Cymbomonas tetramitiformis]
MTRSQNTQINAENDNSGITDTEANFDDEMRQYDARDSKRRSDYANYVKKHGVVCKKVESLKTLILNFDTLMELIPKDTREARARARIFERTHKIIAGSTTKEMHHFYTNVVNYPMQKHVVSSKHGNRKYEIYNFLRQEVRELLRINPDPANNIAVNIVVNENFIDAPIIFTATQETSEQDRILAARANWVELLRSNRFALNGGGISDLPQLLKTKNYDWISKVALTCICNIYICGIHKRTESIVSVCDHMIILACDQASLLFPKNFDSYIMRAMANGDRSSPEHIAYTYDASLTWPTETQGFNFRNCFLKYIFEQTVIDCPMMQRLSKMCEIVIEELNLDIKDMSVARGYVWAQLYVLNVQLAIVCLLTYGPKSEHFRPSDGSSRYTEFDMANLFFEFADGDGIHCRHDAITVYHTPHSTKYGDVLPTCPICLETTHYSNGAWVLDVEEMKRQRKRNGK